MFSVDGSCLGDSINWKAMLEISGRVFRHCHALKVQSFVKEVTWFRASY